MHWSEDEPKPASPPWFITFADLMGILLGFFVLLFALSSLEASRFQALAGSVRQAFGASVGAPARGVVAATFGKRDFFEREGGVLRQAAGVVGETVLDPPRHAGPDAQEANFHRSHRLASLRGVG